MPHVDEGTLHALLDGALRADAPERAAEVRAHLAACEDCRARLEAVEELREDAAGILDAAAPPAAAVAPDFRDVAARAPGGGSSGTRAGRLRRQARWTRGVAWAASLVLALGTGYLIRDLGGPGLSAPDAALEAASRDEPGASLSETGVDGLEDRYTAGSGPNVEERIRQGADQGPSEGHASAGPAAAEAGSGQSRVEPGERQADVAAPPPAPPTPSPEPRQPQEEAPEGAARFEAPAGRALEGTAEEEPTREVARSRLRQESLAMDSVTAASNPFRLRPEPLVSTATTNAQEKAIASREIGAIDSVHWSAVTLNDARAALGGPVFVLPRADLVEIHRLAVDSPTRIMTLQRLQTGVLIRVVQWRGEAEAARRGEARAPAPADRAPALPNAEQPGIQVVRVVRGRYVLELTSSLPPALLSVLGETATPAR